jgi:hypothetical protein
LGFAINPQLYNPADGVGAAGLVLLLLAGTAFS